MSKDKEKPAAEAEDKKGGKGKGVVVKLAIAATLVGAGGAGSYAFLKAGMVEGEKTKEDKAPKLIRKGEEDPYAPKSAEGGKEAEVVAEVQGEGGSEYRTAYYSFSDDFTSNLRNSAGLVQISLACSTRRDGRVLLWLKKHELAIRSGLLAVLADTPEEDVATLEGKERLQKRLTDAINKVLTETEGFGGVDAVYFRSFLVQ